MTKRKRQQIENEIKLFENEMFRLLASSNMSEYQRATFQIYQNRIKYLKRLIKNGGQYTVTVKRKKKEKQIPKLPPSVYQRRKK